MSNAILTWAKTQMAGSPSAKCVLLCLADEASTHGECWTSQETIARETEQSVDSVQRRLRDLEKRGLIYCVSRRHWGDSGKWRTNMIVVLADAICAKFALKHGYDPAAKDASNDESDVSPQNQQDSDATVPQIAATPSDESSENSELGDSGKAGNAANCGTVEMGENRLHRAAPVAVRTVPHCCGTRTQTSEPLSPQSPPSPSPDAVLDEESWLSEWKNFVDAWPWSDGEAFERPRNRFRQMSPEDRGAVLLGIPAYLADCRAKKRRAMRAKAFLGGDWRHWAQVAEGLAKRRAEAGVFVVENSRAWKAWLSHLGVEKHKALFNSGRNCRGFHFPSLFPPGGASDADPVSANIPVEAVAEAEGVFLPEGSDEFAAWAAHAERAGEPAPFAYFNPRRGFRGSLFPAQWPPGAGAGAATGDMSQQSRALR